MLWMNMYLHELALTKMQDTYLQFRWVEGDLEINDLTNTESYSLINDPPFKISIIISRPK